MRHQPEPVAEDAGVAHSSHAVGARKALLREEFQLYVYLRPAHTLVPGGRFEKIDLVLVRENLEGLAVGGQESPTVIRCIYMPKHHWFKPKAFGYGARPISWQGWALTMSVAMLISGSVVVALVAERQQWPNRLQWQTVCVIVAATSFAVLFVAARATTDGEWRWRS